MNSTSTGTALIYGATGYIGRLCARRAVAAGVRPMLAARNATALTSAGRDTPATMLRWHRDQQRTLQYFWRPTEHRPCDRSERTL